MRARAIIAAGTIAALAACAPVPRAPEPHPTEDSVSEVIPLVETCLNAKGEILSVYIVRSSNYPKLDEAALKVARATRYSAGAREGKPLERSCVKFMVKFVLEEGEAVPDGDTPAATSKPLG